MKWYLLAPAIALLCFVCDSNQQNVEMQGQGIPVDELAKAYMNYARDEEDDDDDVLVDFSNTDPDYELEDEMARSNDDDEYDDEYYEDDGGDEDYDDGEDEEEGDDDYEDEDDDDYDYDRKMPAREAHPYYQQSNVYF